MTKHARCIILKIETQSTPKGENIMSDTSSDRIVKNIPIAEELHFKVKKYAAENGMTVTGLATRAIIEYLDRRVKNFYQNSCTVHDK